MLPITALGKSWCDDCTDGFIKVITKEDKIVGAHIVSKEASSLIHILLTAIQNKICINDLKKMTYAHPTYSEGIFEAICRL
jgi:dihydrolipoamide dehydrogenase